MFASTIAHFTNFIVNLNQKKNTNLLGGMSIQGFGGGYCHNSTNASAVAAATGINKSNVPVPIDFAISSKCFCCSRLYYLYFTRTL